MIAMSADDGELWCPRRAESPSGRFPGPDRWRPDRGGLIGQERLGPSCSYCGSLHPDRFLALVREGYIVGPTDKSYKAYLKRPTTEAERDAAKRRWLDGTVGRAARTAAMAAGCSETEADELVLQQWHDQESLLAESTGPEAKFYYQHLSEAQQNEFIELYNTRQMRVGYPGHFYRRPFFCGVGPERRPDPEQA